MLRMLSYAAIKNQVFSLNLMPDFDTSPCGCQWWTLLEFFHSKVKLFQNDGRVGERDNRRGRDRQLREVIRPFLRPSVRLLLLLPEMMSGVETEEGRRPPHHEICFVSSSRISGLRVSLVGPHTTPSTIANFRWLNCLWIRWFINFSKIITCLKKCSKSWHSFDEEKFRLSSFQTAYRAVCYDRA